MWILNRLVNRLINRLVSRHVNRLVNRLDCGRILNSSGLASDLNGQSLYRSRLPLSNVYSLKGCNALCKALDGDSLATSNTSVVMRVVIRLVCFLDRENFTIRFGIGDPFIASGYVLG